MSSSIVITLTKTLIVDKRLKCQTGPQEKSTIARFQTQNSWPKSPGRVSHVSGNTYLDWSLSWMVWQINLTIVGNRSIYRNYGRCIVQSRMKCRRRRRRRMNERSIAIVYPICGQCGTRRSDRAIKFPTPNVTTQFAVTAFIPFSLRLQNSS